MTRFDEMNELLLKYKEYIKQKPGKIEPGKIYNSLSTYEMSYDEKENRVTYDGDLFPKWQEMYKNDYYILERNDFLHFVNADDRALDQIKLYVAPKPSSMDIITTEILNFLKENNIQTYFKAAMKDRNDALTIRLLNEEDARKVTSFINNNDIITKNVRKTNPFLMREGVVGLAYDRLISYNSTIAKLIASYLNERNKNNGIDNICLNDFNNFLFSYFAKTFITCKDIKQYKEDFQKDFEKSTENPADLMLNHLHVINMIHRAVCLEDSIDTVIKNYNLSIDYEYNKTCRNKFCKSLGVNYDDELEKNILDEYIKYASEKYVIGDFTVHDYLNSYAAGNHKSITRDWDYRTKFEYHLPPEKVLEITNGDISNYINSVLNKNKLSKKTR